ncbi:hypothetical protein AB9R01_11215 [Neisseria gonorrhoeae]
MTHSEFIKTLSEQRGAKTEYAKKTWLIPVFSMADRKRTGSNAKASL